MKPTVQVVELNDFEIQAAYKLAEYIRPLGKGFKWRHDAGGGPGFGLRYSVDEATEDKVVVTGMIGVPSFRLAIKGPHVSFSTIDSISPPSLYYNFCHILDIETSGAGELLRPDVENIKNISTDIRDYYLVNREDSAAISVTFEQALADRENAEKKYTNGMFFIVLSFTDSGQEQGIPLAKAFAESSSFDDVAIAFVFCRGRGGPVFYANGGVYYPLADKDFCQSIQEDFTRIFSKMIARKDKLEIFNADPEIRRSRE